MKTTDSTSRSPSFEPKDFRLLLQHELMGRCEKNPKYSLRAFARALGTSHATLSSILSGKRPLTSRSIIQLAAALKLSPSKTKNFLRRLNAHDDGAVGAEKSAPLQHQELTLDIFVSISEWYHDAILELTHIKSFRPDLKWISKVLGITSSEVKIAVERLQRLALLEVNDSGKWIDKSRNNTTNITNDLTSSALRRLQKKILERSQKALDNLPRTKRDHTSMTLAMQSSDLPAIKEKIKQFRFELAAFIEREALPLQARLRSREFPL